MRNRYTVNQQNRTEGIVTLGMTRKVIHLAFLPFLISVLQLSTFKVLNHCMPTDPRILRSTASIVQA